MQSQNSASTSQMNFNNPHSVKTKKKSGKMTNGALKQGLHSSKDSNNKIYANQQDLHRLQLLSAGKISHSYPQRDARLSQSKDSRAKYAHSGTNVYTRENIG